MNYIQQLRDAGYNKIYTLHPSGHDNGGEYVLLSELIEACADEQRDLRLLQGVDGWFALRGKGNSNLFMGSGATPEEAVARLRLALNQNANS